MRAVQKNDVLMTCYVDKTPNYDLNKNILACIKIVNEQPSKLQLIRETF